MDIDWTAVKKMTLWNYEDLIEKIHEVLSYNFIQEHYNHNMNEAIRYAQKLLGYNQKHEGHINKVSGIFAKLDSLGIESYDDLVLKVQTMEKCQNFIEKTNLQFKDLIAVLNHLFRWVLPHKLYLRELIDAENNSHKKYVEELRRANVRFNLDILQLGRTEKGRAKISEKTGIPEAFISSLVDRADMSRLPYSNRKTVKYLSAAGYGSLAKLAETNSEKIADDLESYFNRAGVRLAGFIDLKGIAQWAKTVPQIIKT